MMDVEGLIAKLLSYRQELCDCDDKQRCVPHEIVDGVINILRQHFAAHESAAPLKNSGNHATENESPTGYAATVRTAARSGLAIVGKIGVNDSLHGKSEIDPLRAKPDTAGGEAERAIPEGVVRIRSDMNPAEYMDILREDDGDLILTISSFGISNTRRSASIQICVPSTGGGKHPELWNALARIYKLARGEDIAALMPPPADAHDTPVATIPENGGNPPSNTQPASADEVELVAQIIAPAFFGENAKDWEPDYPPIVQENARKTARKIIAALRPGDMQSGKVDTSGGGGVDL